jgi:hypothetical protein
VWLNAEHIRALPVQELSRELEPFFKRAGFDASPEKMMAVTPLIRERIKLLGEGVSAADFFFLDQLAPYDPAELIPLKKGESSGDVALALRVLETAQQVLATTAFDHDSLDAALRGAAASLGLKAGPMFQPIRVAVCGRKNAPPLFETLVVLGREVCLERIRQAEEVLRPLNTNLLVVKFSSSPTNARYGLSIFPHSDPTGLGLDPSDISKHAYETLEQLWQAIQTCELVTVPNITALEARMAQADTPVPVAQMSEETARRMGFK